jgi:hypothetical protein
MAKAPRIDFIFPFRWLKEDKEFLEANIIRRVRGNSSKVILDDLLPQPEFSAFSILIHLHAFQPIPIPLTKAQLVKIFKKIFPGAILVNYETRFVQNTQRSSLPTLQMQIYF